MNIWSIFKNHKKGFQQLKPFAMLLLIQEYIPEFYKENKRFKESEEYLRYNEWGLALESLIELADDSGHYFSNCFWNNLTICANKMEMFAEAEYCRQQLIKNETTLGSKLPNGSTAVKIDDNTYQHYTAKIVINKLADNRREKDKLDELINNDGFHIKWHGRGGIIYYVDNGKVLEISFEMSGVRQYDLLPCFDGLKGWSIPANKPFAFKEKSAIKEKFLEWLKTKRIKTDIQ